MSLKIIGSALLLACVTGALLPCSANGQERCYSDTEGRAMIESQRVNPFPDAAHRAGIPPEQVQGVELCDSDRGYSYEVDVLREGRRERTRIPADGQPGASSDVQE